MLVLEKLFPFTALVVTALGLHFLLSSKLVRHLAIDTPNQRSLHAVPVPRIGGMVLVPAFLLTWGMMPDRNNILTMLTAVLALFSYLDDRSGLSAKLRLGVHLAAAAVFVVSNLDLTSALWVVAAILWIGWCTNLYNFMDGADGLAGGMALFGFAAYGFAATVSGESALSNTSYSVAAAAVGFLLFNFPPAKTFMGDAGSIPLGFLAGSIGLLGWNEAAWPLWYPVLVFSPFIVDATVTLLKRLLRGERVWEAHREHYYQRLVRLGWSHRRLALTEYGLMAACSVSALLLLKCADSIKYVGLMAVVSIYALAMIMVDLCWKKYLSKTSGS